MRTLTKYAQTVQSLPLSSFAKGMVSNMFEKKNFKILSTPAM